MMMPRRNFIKENRNAIRSNSVDNLNKYNSDKNTSFNSIKQNQKENSNAKKTNAGYLGETKSFQQKNVIPMRKIENMMDYYAEK